MFLFSMMTALVVGSVPLKAQTVRLSSPVTGGSCTIFSEFGNRRHPFLGKVVGHGAYDLAPMPRGSTLYVQAAASGRVVDVGYNSTCGHYVEVMHSTNLYTLYCHMRGRTPVSVGSNVSVGTRLGVVGNSGRSTGPHLHFAVKTVPGWSAPKSAHIDPVPRLMSRETLGCAAEVPQKRQSSPSVRAGRR